MSTESDTDVTQFYPEPMNPEIKARWVQALRSGDYKQGTKYLRNRETNQYCCLGVLCDLALKEGVVAMVDEDITMEGGTEYYDPRNTSDIEYTVLPDAVAKWAGFRVCIPRVPYEGYPVGRGLADLNDVNGLSFERIAELIEEHL